MATKKVVPFSWFTFNDLDEQAKETPVTPTPIESASRLEKQVTLAGDSSLSYSALELLTAGPNNTYQKAVPDSNANAKVAGILISSGFGGQTATMVTRGSVSDNHFSFTKDLTLFLNINSRLTDTVPTSGFLTRVAISQGVGEILFNPQYPIQLN